MSTANHSSRIAALARKIPIRYWGLLPILMVSTLLGIFFLYTTDQYEKVHTDAHTRAELRKALAFYQQLYTADFHGTLTGPSAISQEKFHQLVQRNDQLVQELGLQYLWSVIVVDGQVRFATATSPDPGQTGGYAPFYSVHSDPAAFDEALQNNTDTYGEFHNEWGDGMMLLRPYKDSRNRRYILGASVAIHHEEAASVMRYQQLAGVLFAIFIATLIGSAVSAYQTRPIAELSHNIEHAMLEESASFERINWAPPEIQNLQEAFLALIEQKDLYALQCLENQEEMQSIVDAIPLGVITTSPLGQIDLCNEAARAILNIEPTDQDNNLAAFLPLDARKVLFAQPDRIAQNVRMRATIALAPGHESEIELRGRAATRNNGELFYIFTIEDITELRAEEEALIRENELLSATVMIAGLGHDLANLMIGLKLHLDQLKLHIPADTTRPFTKGLEEGIDMGASLAQSLKSLGTDEPNEVAVGLHAWLKAVLEFVFHTSKIAWHLEVEESAPKVSVDRERLTRAIGNILKNARETLDADRSVRVSASLYKQAGQSQLQIDIIDDGAGIPDNLKELIFRPYFSQKHGGTGLGLTISRNIVENLGGTLEIVSSSHGAHFRIVVPVRRSEDSGMM